MNIQFLFQRDKSYIFNETSYQVGNYQTQCRLEANIEKTQRGTGARKP